MLLSLIVFLLVLFVLYSYRGAIFGATVGGTGDNLNNVQDLFFRTVFTLLGYVAKRDGPINEKEVKRTETYMEKMDLDPQQRREAIRLFKVGAEPQFNADKTIKDFQGLAQKSPNLAQILLVYLINLARVDGLLVTKEVDAVQKVALGLGYSSVMFKHLLQMISSQYKFGNNFEQDLKTSNTKQSESDTASKFANQGAESKTKSSEQQSKATNKSENSDESCAEKTEDFNTRNDQLGPAYEVFDLPATASDADIKKAYRGLVNQYHPDKLMGQGLPPYMIQSATECFQTIQAAYNYIKKARAK
jgi:DnaJ like chaperone protein